VTSKHRALPGFVRNLASRTTLRLQLLLVLLLTFGVALASSYWVNTRVESRALDEVQSYVESASQAVQVSVSRLRAARSGIAIVTLEADAIPAGVRRLTLRDTSERVLAETPPAGALPDDPDLVSYRIPLVDAGILIGYLDVELTTTSLRGIFRDMIVAKAELWSVVFLLGALLLVPVASTISQSHRQIERLVASVAGGDLEPEFPEPMSVEAGGLFASFRTLLSQLRQQKEMESQLARAEREASIGRMTSGVAHDIRNPLNYVELAVGELWRKRQVAGQPGPDEAALYEGVRQELGRVNEITNDLLSLGRPYVPELRNEDAGAILLECREELNRRRPDRGRDCVFEPPGKRLLVRADRDLTERVLTNVLDNAIDATQPGDPVRCGCKRDGHSKVLFWVEDSGPGIPEDLIGHMFEPYITGKPSGTGLGLALAYQWVRDMHGDIEVKNRDGGGARVEIRLRIGEGDSGESDS